MQELGGVADGGAQEGSGGAAKEAAWSEVLQRTGTRQCDMRLNDDQPLEKGTADPRHERRRLALVHGIHVGGVK